MNIGQVMRAAERQGWKVDKRKRSGHFRFLSPKGQPVFTAGTPSDSYRGLRNLLAMLRKHGLEFPR